MPGVALAERMKGYEKVWDFKLPRRMPVIIRLDGKNFHTFTKDLTKPFDQAFMNDMMCCGEYLCQNVQNTVFAYTQSDEISLLLHNYKTLSSEPYLGNEILKLVSITAGMASAFMSGHSISAIAGRDIKTDSKLAVFDSRAFVLPESEVANYFIWRQQDATRNSIQMVAQSLYSHNELQGKNNSELQEMIFQKGINWNNIAPARKRGYAVIQNIGKIGWYLDWEVPIFTDNRGYIESLLGVEE